jgi:hypothetical protein
MRHDMWLRDRAARGWAHEEPLCGLNMILCSDLQGQRCARPTYGNTGAIKWFCICSIFGNGATATFREEGRKDVSITLGAASMRTPTPTQPPAVSELLARIHQSILRKRTPILFKRGSIDPSNDAFQPENCAQFSLFALNVVPSCCILAPLCWLCGRRDLCSGL